MLKSILALTLASAFIATLPALGQTVPPATPEQVNKLVTVLKSEATQKEKADACRQLAIIGTPDAIDTLAALLADEKMSHMARYALEPIADPAVDEALRAAAGKLQGRLQAGVIHSLGIRRDAKAVEVLEPLLQSPDDLIAQTTARALGSIGTPEAAQALGAALPKASTANQLAFCEGALRCAESLIAAKKGRQAMALYDQLRELSVPHHQVRTAALRGALLTHKDRLELLRQSLGEQDYILFSAAARTAQEMRNPRVTAVLTAALGQLPADRQIVVMQTLGKRKDATAVPVLAELAGKAEKPARLAAIRAMAEIGDASALPTFKSLLKDGDREISRAALESFASLQGNEIDAAILAMLNSTDNSDRLGGVELIGRRRMISSVPELLKTAKEAEVQVRPAALKQVGELGGPAEAPAVIELLLQARDGQVVDAAEQALSALCAKAGNAEACAEKVSASLAQAQPAQKAALARVLSTIGGPTALKAVRRVANESEPETRAAAIRALGTWKTADAAPDLLALAKSANEETLKKLSLRSYLGLAANAEVPAPERLSMCREASALAQDNEQKQMLLAALGGLTTPEALPLITPYLSDAATRDEATAAAVGIAERLLRGNEAAKVAPKLVEPLGQVAQAATNADLAQRAKNLLQEAKRKSDGK